MVSSPRMKLIFPAHGAICFLFPFSKRCLQATTAVRDLLHPFRSWFQMIYIFFSNECLGKGKGSRKLGLCCVELLLLVMLRDIGNIFLPFALVWAGQVDFLCFFTVYCFIIITTTTIITRSARVCWPYNRITLTITAPSPSAT